MTVQFVNPYDPPTATATVEEVVEEVVEEKPAPRARKKRS